MPMRLLLYLTLLCAYSVGYSQKLVFENIGVKRGLPATEVYNLFQDKKGYVWVFTEYGVVKYNGSSFVPVCKNLPLKESAVYAVTESQDGNLYIANIKGVIYRIHNDKVYKVQGTEKVTRDIQKYGDAVISIFFMDNGDLRITSMTDTYVLKKGSFSTEGLSPEKQVRTSQVTFDIHKRAVIPRKKYELSILGSDGRTHGSWIPLNDSHSRTGVVELNGRTYAFYEDFILSEDRKGMKKQLYTGVEIIKMKSGPDGHLWVCLNTGGLLELDGNLNFLNRYFDSKIISDVIFDSQSGMWVSTVGAGLYHCDNIHKKSYVNIPELKEEISLIQKINGKLFIGTTQGKKLFVMEGLKIRQLPIPEQILGPNDILYHNNRYYIAGEKGLAELDVNGTLHAWSKYLTYGLASVDNDRLLTIGPTTVGYYYPSTGKDDLIVFNSRNRCLAERVKGEFFTAATRGICRIKDGKVNFPRYLDELKEKNVSRIIADKEGNLWFCTRGDGVYCLNRRNHLTHFGNLPSTIVYNIQITDDNLVLLSTNLGAFVTKRVNINDKRAWKSLLDEETLYMQEYGGQLYIGTKNGLTVIDRDKLFRDKTYQFYLTSVKVGNREVNLSRRNSLNYDENDLYFNFDFLDFQDHYTRLNYSLSGPDGTRGVVSGNQIHLQNLQPGTYKLSVYPKMNFSDGKSLTRTVTFTIHPAFWQTGWFITVCAVLFAGLIFLGALMVIRRNNRKRESKDQIERLLTEYRLTALKAQVNPHFMSNSLVAIQRLILERETDKANLYIAKFSLLLRSLLDYSNKSAATLKAEIGMIELYVELEQLRFSNQFVFELEITPDLDLEDVFVPPLITQPFVENAIWHGLLPLKKTRNPELKLKVSLNDEGIVISIIDNGVGRTERKQITERESKGTKLIVQRMESLNQLYQTKGGKIEFLDLNDANGKPCGTRVNIVIPNEILNELYNGKNKGGSH